MIYRHVCKLFRLAYSNSRGERISSRILQMFCYILTKMKENLKEKYWCKRRQTERILRWLFFSFHFCRIAYCRKNTNLECESSLADRDWFFRSALQPLSYWDTLFTYFVTLLFDRLVKKKKNLRKILSMKKNCPDFFWLRDRRKRKALMIGIENTHSLLLTYFFPTKKQGGPYLLLLWQYELSNKVVADFSSNLF